MFSIQANPEITLTFVFEKDILNFISTLNYTNDTISNFIKSPVFSEIKDIYKFKGNKKFTIIHRYLKQFIQDIIDIKNYRNNDKKLLIIKKMFKQFVSENYKEYYKSKQSNVPTTATVTNQSNVPI